MTSFFANESKYQRDFRAKPVKSRLPLFSDSHRCYRPSPPVLQPRRSRLSRITNPVRSSTATHSQQEPCRDESKQLCLMVSNCFFSQQRFRPHRSTPRRPKSTATPVGRLISPPVHSRYRRFSTSLRENIQLHLVNHFLITCAFV